MDTIVPHTGAYAIGDLFGRIVNPDERRWKVHADTTTRKGEEGTFFRPIHKRLKARIMFAAQQEERAGRKENRLARNRKRNGPLGPVAIEVLRYLLSIANIRTGQLDPALATIAREVGHSVEGVRQALVRLRNAGFVQWIRRYVETGHRGRRGPQLEQASNAYRITVPAKVAATWTDAPLPDDELWRRKADRAAFADMTRDPQLQMVLDSLEAALERDATSRDGIHPRLN